MKVPFVKMHGNGNDFVIVDNTKLQLQYNKKIIERLSNRRTGIGCDQFIFLEDSKGFDIFMKIFNANGEEAEMCGNAARCVASLIIAGNNKKKIRVGGMVKKDSILIKASEVKFIITDFKNEINVTYTGAIPNLFEEGKGVVAEGVLNDRNFFSASKILAKHDENYMPPEVKQALGEK